MYLQPCKIKIKYITSLSSLVAVRELLAKKRNLGLSERFKAKVFADLLGQPRNLTPSRGSLENPISV